MTTERPNMLTRRTCSCEDMDRRFKPFLNKVIKFTNENYNEYASELTFIVEYLFGEVKSQSDLHLHLLFQFLGATRKIILDKSKKYNIKSAVKMANIVSGRKLSATESDRIYFETFFVLILYHETYKNIASMLYFDTETFLNDYPSFGQLVDVDSEELVKLLLFRNWMRVALLVITPHYNKGRLLNIVTRICEGDTVKYISGTVQNAATERRVLIYEKEGNIIKKARPLRRLKELVNFERPECNVNNNNELQSSLIPESLTEEFQRSISSCSSGAPCPNVSKSSNKVAYREMQATHMSLPPTIGINYAYRANIDLLNDLEKPWIADEIDTSYGELAARVAATKSSSAPYDTNNSYSYSYSYSTMKFEEETINSCVALKRHIKCIPDCLENNDMSNDRIGRRRKIIGSSLETWK